MPEGLAELCQVFKSAEQALGVSLIADRVEALKLLAAFALYPLSPWYRPKKKMPEDGRERWLWLWSGFKGGPLAPDFLDSLAAVAGVSAETAYRVWPSLMASRVLFPDGTLSDEGRVLLQARVMRSLPRPPSGLTTRKGPKNG